MSLLLAIDTSGPSCAVCLADQASGHVIFASSDEIGRGHAERLFPMIETALAETGITYRELGRVGVLRGPGSFTGLRVGLAAARGLALALGVPAIGIDAFAAFHADIDPSQPLGIALDARRGQVWVAEFGEEGRPLSPPRALDLDTISQWPFLTHCICGSGGAALISACGKAEAATLLHHGAQPSVAAVARLAISADPSSNPASALYLRAADAKPAAPSPVKRVATP